MRQEDSRPGQRRSDLVRLRIVLLVAVLAAALGLGAGVLAFDNGQGGGEPKMPTVVPLAEQPPTAPRGCRL